METVTPPARRRCVRCNRTEVWSDQQRTWVVQNPGADTDDGTPYCVHEWDITGSYNPLGE